VTQIKISLILTSVIAFAACSPDSEKETVTVTPEQQQLDQREALKAEASAREEKRLQAKALKERAKRCFNLNLSEPCQIYKLEKKEISSGIVGTQHSLTVKAQNAATIKDAETLVQDMKIYCYEPSKIDILFESENSKYGMSTKANEIRISFDYGKTEQSYPFYSTGKGALSKSSTVSKQVISEIYARSDDGVPHLQLTYQTANGFFESFYYDISVLREPIQAISSTCAVEL